MTTLEQISSNIIHEQELIIGPLAWTEAGKVSGIKILNQTTRELKVASNEPKDVINALVARYERLFGKLSHDICKEAARDLIKTLSPDQIPTSLK